jgi:alkylation response protein AidB-like acyl-CoA dehydrogenase
VPEDSILVGDADGASALDAIIDLGAAMITAETVGAAERALEITTDFAKQRIQFDSPIGRYQGVKHPLAEMFVDIESYKSLVYYAFWALDEAADDASLAVSRAKAYASESFPDAGITGVQLHGGVGYTWEYDIQLFLKRGKWMRPVYGDADYHYDRIAHLGGL